MENRIYINIAVIGSVNEVINNILNRISDSKLYDNVSKIYLVVNGNIELLDIEIKDKYEIIKANSDINKCEFPTLDLISEHSIVDFNLLYLHTKGVTKPGFVNIKDWTNYLSYFNIDRWEDRLSELEYNDCTGCDLKGNPDDINHHPMTWGYGKAPLHYSGNFWWAKSSHIRKLVKPSNWLPDTNYQRWRIMAEMWVCQDIKSIYNNAWSSGVNHYYERYEKEKYEK